MLQPQGLIGFLIIPIVIVISLAVGLAVGYYFKKYQYEKLQKEQKIKADGIILQAQEQSRSIEIQAKDDALKILQAAEAETSRRRGEFAREDDRLTKRRTELDHRLERLEQREQVINKRQSALDKRVNEADKIFAQQMAELQRIGQMTVEEARAVLLEQAEKEARNDMARIIRQIEAEAREQGEVRARELITDAIQRIASDRSSKSASRGCGFRFSPRPNFMAR